MAGEDGVVDDVLGDHRLAEALGRDEDDVGARAEEVELEGTLDGGAVDLPRPLPLEVGHGLEVAELAAGEAAYEAAALLLLGLLGCNALEQAARAGARLGGVGDEVVEVLGGVVHAEGAELGGEISHGGGPRRR